MPKKLPKSNKEDISREFNERKPHFDSLEEEALFTVDRSLKKTDIKLHSITSRVKKLDSFLDKIDRFQIQKPFEQIDDIVGVRVICLFLSDIERIGEIIRNCFKVIRDDNKIDNSKFTSFGYMSVHFIAKLGDGYKGTRYEGIVDIPFEIQVRTIAMDAWANISHYLEYKTEQDIPEELKKDFYALSGMFYVADKHFQLFFEQRKEKQEELVEEFDESAKENKFDQPLNLDTLIAYLQTKFPERYEGTPGEYISRALEVLRETGYETIEQVNQIVDKGHGAALAWEADKGGESGWNAMGFVVRLFELIDPKFQLNYWTKSYKNAGVSNSKKFAQEDVTKGKTELKKYRDMLVSR